MTDEILIDREGPIAIVTLNRPKALNALTLAMCRALLPKIAEWAQDPELHAVVLRGAGDRAFCAGGDLRAAVERGPQSGVPGGDLEQDFFWVEYRLNHAIHHFPKPWIALLDGVMVGPADLAISMGHLRDMENAEVEAAIRRILEACLRHDVPFGMFTGTAEKARKWIGLGGQIATVGGDVPFIDAGIAQAKRDIARILEEGG